jgi:hypothetical protein
MNLTTNEMFNYKRYSYLRDNRGRYQNPFSQGLILNLLEFFICHPDFSNYHDFLEEELRMKEPFLKSLSLSAVREVSIYITC